MRLVIELDMDNAAFAPYPGPELERILRHLGSRMVDYFDPRDAPSIILDSNGNTVGHVTITESD